MEKFKQEKSSVKLMKKSNAAKNRDDDRIPVQLVFHTDQSVIKKLDYQRAIIFFPP